jgi:NADH-quinone oxidoreductase subunit F
VVAVSVPFAKVLTARVGRPGSQRIETYLADGGYAALAKALAMTPDRVVEEVKASGLRGRGGAGFPTGLKWSFMPKEPRKPHYLVNNADESEPGTFKDRLLMEHDPHLVIEGTLIAAYAIRARTAFVYVRGEFVHPHDVMARALDEARSRGYIGRNVLGSGWDCEVVLHRGAGAYICGEETALMTSLEGGKGFPRLKPPFPAQAGLWGCPTTVNNVETLANVPFIIDRGAAWYAAIGREKNTGPKLYCMSGHLKRPGVYEASMGVPLRELIYDHAGGMLRDDRPLKAVIPGGASTGVLTAAEVDVPMDFDALRGVGSMLGSAGCMVMDSSVCMVKALWINCRFFAHESCGQCTPCRVGCDWMEKIVGRIEAGSGRRGDLDLLVDVAARINGQTICPLGDAAAGPVATYVDKFRDDFLHHIDNRTSTCLAQAEPARAL